MGTFLLTLLALLGMFLMLVILIQRGRGGGLAGAFGGLGGQSAFGTKAGDVFTVITIITAILWVTLACLTGWRLRVEASSYYAGREGADAVESVSEDEGAAGGMGTKDDSDEAAKPKGKKGDANKKKSGAKETNAEKLVDEGELKAPPEKGSKPAVENGDEDSDDKDAKTPPKGDSPASDKSDSPSSGNEGSAESEPKESE